MNSHRFATCLGVALCLAVAPAADGATSTKTRHDADAWCGAEDTSVKQVLAEHDYNRRRLTREFNAEIQKGALPTIKTIDVRKEGNIGVFVGDAPLISDENLVDVQDFGINFKYKKKKDAYLPRPLSGGVSEDFGDQLDLADDDTTRIDLPFNFEFFGVKHKSVNVNSDGNLTFGGGDVEIDERDIARMLDGPPRISPFFRDLNPETAPAGGGVFAQVAPKSLKVTWFRVPEFDQNGINTTVNTFSVTLFKNGRVAFRYGELLSETAVVGLAPGGGSGVELLDFSDELPAPLQRQAIAEDFSDQLSVDHAAITNLFLDNFKDRYTHLVVFEDFPIVLLGQPGVIAFAFTLKNQVRGIGDDIFDFSGDFGSDGTLETYINMGDVGKYPLDVEAPSFFSGANTAGDILMHEIGHRWGVSALFEKDGQIRDDLLGRTDAHWSFCMDGDRSFLEGSDLMDNGDGTYVTTPGPQQYNGLDRYFMGLEDPAAVPDFFFLEGCNGDRAPQDNVTVSGTRVDVTIDDVIRALGPRDPAFGEAPTKFNVAFLLLVREGEEPRPTSIKQMNDFRKLAEREFAANGGKLNTKLKKR